MHTITIQANDAGSFDVLMNGVSYRIHRNLSEDGARIRSAEILASFREQGQRARIVGLVRPGGSSTALA